MSDLLTLLIDRGLPDDATAKIVRHFDTRSWIDFDLIERQGWIETYQSFQAKRIFECDYVVVFIGIDDNRGRFFGVYRVNGDGQPTPIGNLPSGFPHPQFDEPGGFYYDLTRDKTFDDLDGLVIEWGTRPINWHLWLVNKTGSREFKVVDL